MTLTSLGLQALAAAFVLPLPLMDTTALPRLRPLSRHLCRWRHRRGRAPHAVPSTVHRKLSGQKCWATCCALHGIFQSLSRMSPLTRHRRSWVQAARMFGAAPAPAIPMKFSNSIGTGAKPALRSSNTASSQGTTIAYEGGRSDLQSTAPSLPRSARMQGPGVLEAVTSQQGTMENLRVLTGIPCRLALLRPQQRTGRGRDANHVNFSPSGS